jgi:cytochrome P450
VAVILLLLSFTDSKRATQLIVQFAGHDTTGHTLSFIAFELARQPDVQAKLQAEVDSLWASLGGRDLEYCDFKELPYMTRVVTETLRLWCVVPQGTFRRLQFDDYVTVGGDKVPLPKGTYVQIQNW